MGTMQVGGSMWWWKPVKMLFYLPLLSERNRNPGNHLRMNIEMVLRAYRARRYDIVIQERGECMDS